MGKFIITVFGLLVSIRGIRIYSRTGLKGELLIAVAGFIFVLAFQANDTIMGIVGYIIMNIGIFLLYKKEKPLWKVVFGPLTTYNRLVGNVPQVLNEKDSRITYKVTGVISGILCLLMGFEVYRSLKLNDLGGLIEKELVGLIEIVVLILAGLSLTGYYYFKKAE